MAGLGFLLVFWVLAGACQRHGIGGFCVWFIKKKNNNKKPKGEKQFTRPFFFFSRLRAKQNFPPQNKFVRFAGKPDNARSPRSVNGSFFNKSCLFSLVVCALYFRARFVCVRCFLATRPALAREPNLALPTRRIRRGARSHRQHRAEGGQGKVAWVCCRESRARPAARPCHSWPAERPPLPKSPVLIADSPWSPCQEKL